MHEKTTHQAKKFQSGPEALFSRAPSWRTPKRAEVERGGADSAARKPRLSEARARSGCCLTLPGGSREREVWGKVGTPPRFILLCPISSSNATTGLAYRNETSTQGIVIPQTPRSFPFKTNFICISKRQRRKTLTTRYFEVHTYK